jgi:hypothetical protein
VLASVQKAESFRNKGERLVQPGDEAVKDNIPSWCIQTSEVSKTSEVFTASAITQIGQV